MSSSQPPPETQRSTGPATPNTIRVRLVVHGHVQGVFFRDTTRRLANESGVAGTVRNRGDGTVEAVFEGPPGAVDRLVAFCRHGPEAARVDRVELSPEEPLGETGFRVS